VALVDAVKSHQGIQNEQPGSQPLDCLHEPRAVRIAIEPQHGRGDDVDRDLGEIETATPSTVQANKEAAHVAIATAIAGLV
jgi:hypothetical protein